MGPETWDESMWIFTFENPELSDSPELSRHAQVAHSVRRWWIPLAWRSCRSFHSLVPHKITLTPLWIYPTSPPTKQTNKRWDWITGRTPKTFILSTGMRGSRKYIGGLRKMHAFHRKINPPKIQWCFQGPGIWGMSDCLKNIGQMTLQSVPKWERSTIFACMHVLSRVWLFVTLCIVAHILLLHGIFQTRIPLSAANSYSRGSSWPRDRTHISCISCIGKQILYHWATWEDYNTEISLI